MGNEILDLKTNNNLLQDLHEALAKKPTHEEISEQRVSFVYGSLGADSDVTRDRVRQVLAEQEGTS